MSDANSWSVSILQGEEGEKERKKVEEREMKEREGRKEGKKIWGGDKEKEKKRKGKRKESSRSSGNSAWCSE